MPVVERFNVRTDDGREFRVTMTRNDIDVSHRGNPKAAPDPGLKDFWTAEGWRVTQISDAEYEVGHPDGPLRAWRV